ncbi:patatin-like phospholipase family protein [Streptomyces sp. SM11]|uniref:patatin-like phospholipase family protein n=1 Tax=Streptomyces sp. SM11 TaxID=565557 RepID=UPI000CD51DA9|nr:patatin-like phospholipase family protein [Streptomyces sp. SM11]
MDGQDKVAFVLGGGGERGGNQVGMVRALLERGIVPDVVVGTSIGAVQGAIIAKNPTATVVSELTELWMEFISMKVMKPSLRAVLDNLRHARIGLTSEAAAERMLLNHFAPHSRIEDLKLPFICPASSIERAAPAYFDRGLLIPALLASCCVPGVFPPVKINGEHYLDGGLIDSLPVGVAASLGATTIYALRIRQTETQLSPPKMPWELAYVTFEVSRRAAVEAEVSRSRPGVTLHALPSGEDDLVKVGRSLFKSARDELETVRRRIRIGYDATSAYLDHASESVEPAKG